MFQCRPWSIVQGHPKILDWNFSYATAEVYEAAESRFTFYLRLTQGTVRQTLYYVDLNSPA
jgi:hypothetical protein